MPRDCRRFLTAFAAVVAITCSMCFVSLRCDLTGSSTASAQHAGSVPVAEPCLNVVVSRAGLLEEPVAAESVVSASVRSWQLSYRARAFGRS